MPPKKSTSSAKSTGSTSSSSSSSGTKGVHVHGFWRHYEDGSKTYISPAVRHIKK